MTAAKILVVEEVGMDVDADLAVIRGNPTTAGTVGFDLHACLVGNPTTGDLLKVSRNVDVDFTNLAACRDAVRAEIEAVPGNTLTVMDDPVYRGHCWRNNGWAECQLVYSFVVKSRATGQPYGDDVGFLNRLMLKTRFLAVIQAP